MKRSVAKKYGQGGCRFSLQDQKVHWYCGLLEFIGKPCAIVTQKGRIKWATSSAHKLLLRYWPGCIGIENRLPPQIHQWVTRCRKQQAVKGAVPTIGAPLTLNRSSSCLTVRYMHDGRCSVLLFEELLLDLPVDHLVSLGLTPREAEVLQWLVRGKCSFEISRILNISDRTVSKHLGRVYLKLGVENRHAAVALMHDELKRTTPRR